MSIALDESVTDYPVSTRLVYLVLTTADEPLSKVDLVERTALHPDTVSGALQTLRRETNLHSRRSLADARRSIYFYPKG